MEGIYENPIEFHLAGTLQMGRPARQWTSEKRKEVVNPWARRPQHLAIHD
jgi:hypothetical protein